MDSDRSIFSKSMMAEGSKEPFTQKQVLYVSDSNNSSYNGSISFDTTVIANSARWTDYSQAVIEVPLCISLVSTGDISATMQAFAFGLKSGFYHLIDSISCEINNKSCVQQQAYTNFYVNYRILSEWSQDDLAKWGDILGVAPDSAGASKYSAGAANRGDGISNNSPYDIGTRTFTSADSLVQSNKGYAHRLEQTADPAAGYGALGILNTAARHNSAGKAYYETTAAGDNTEIYKKYVIATIRLKDVSDFFAKLPLVRGCQMRLVVNYNSSRHSITAAAAGNGTFTTAGITMLSGRTAMPMISASGANYPGAPAASANGTITLECNVRATTSPAGSAADLLPSCRLYVPCYRMNEAYEIEYLASPQRSVQYNDIYQYTITNVGAGAAFQQILSSAIVNPKQLVVIPFINKAGHATAAFEEFQSAFSSAPSTTTPLASITNFQVSVSGENIFSNTVSYDFEQFLFETSQTGIEGAQVSGLASGLISRKMFEDNYRFYVVDLSRRLPADDVIPKSILVSGTNNTAKAMDYYCFVLYGRTLNLDVSTSAVLDVSSI